MTAGELDAFLRREFPQMYVTTDTIIERVDGRACRIRQTFHESMLRPGGTVSGPTLMALADCAMYVSLLAAIGPQALAVTTSLNVNFLNKGAAGVDLVAAARLLKLGKRLAVGEVSLFSGTSEELLAHATMTYSIPPKRDV